MFTDTETHILEPILLAEDEPNDTFVIEDLFKRAGVCNPLQLLGDGEATINYLEGTGIYSDRTLYPFPVLLMLDLVMPRKSGWEVLTWLSTQPERLSLDVVVVSKSTDFDSQRMAFECGAQSFLTKPFELESLMNLINALRYGQLEAREYGYQVRRCPARHMWFV